MDKFDELLLEIQWALNDDGWDLVWNHMMKLKEEMRQSFPQLKIPDDPCVEEIESAWIKFGYAVDEWRKEWLDPV
ncbi:MAG: hypothetical protein ACXABY_32175 [Candidatus Thorarchaeota archaeon]|jgi:hypothetical protein